MVLRPRGCGRVGRRRHLITKSRPFVDGFFFVIGSRNEALFAIVRISFSGGLVSVSLSDPRTICPHWVSPPARICRIPLLHLVTLTLAIAACKDAAAPPEPDPVGQVIVTLPQPGLAVGFSIQATDTVKDANGAILTGRSVTWSSSNTAVARVTQDGVVTGVGRGIAEIKATSGQKSGSATIGVVTIKQQSISVSGSHVCAISVDGDMYCWGANYAGQIGNREERNYPLPTLVQGGLKFLAVATAGDNTYALTKDGRFYCWGFASLCDPNAPTRVISQRGWPVIFAPWPVPTTRAIEVLSSSQGTCAVATMNVAHCWGSNTYGQRGTGAPSSDYSSAPDERVTGDYAFAQIAGGYSHHACGLTTAGAAYCWGDGALGALGDGSGTGSAAPRRVAGNHVFKSIGAGDQFTCGLATSGELYCWGWNPFGATGPCLGQEKPCSATPVAVSAGRTFESMSVGVYTFCGVTAAGEISCSGFPFRSPVVDQPGGVRFRTVSVGHANACAITDTGDIYCRGANNFGELGNGTVDDMLRFFAEPGLVRGGIKFRTP